MLNYRTLALSLLLLVSVVPIGAGVQPGPSLLIVNGRVFTGIPAQPWAEALAIAGDRIIGVGTSAAMKLKVPATSATRIIDAQGQLVVPGLNDAHVHVGASPPATRLEGPPAAEHDPSLDEVVARLKVALAKAPKGGWILGEIGAHVLDDPKATRVTIDAVAPDHPVVLTAFTGHGSLLNTLALRRLNVRDDEPDPPGGMFGRVPGTKTLTGVAHEYASFMIWQRLAATTDQQRLIATLRSASKVLAGYGITSIQAMLTAQTVDVLSKAIVEADVPMRFTLVDVPFHAMEQWRARQWPQETTGRIRISGTKWILDGTPVERLMFMRQPYSDRPETRGRLNFTPTALLTFLRAALAAGQQPMLHACGDATIDEVLHALEVSGGERWRPLRPRIEHGDMFEPGHVKRATQLGVVLVQNPSHFVTAGIVKARLGERTARFSMMKSLIASGVPVALGSDGPANPFLNMMFAITNPTNTAETMTREQVLAAYTQGSAFAEHQETQKGTLAPGMLADLAILSQDVFTVPTEKLPATQSILTVIGGRIVHEAKN